MKVSKLDLSELLDSEEVIAGVLNDALQSNETAVLMKTIGYVAKARGVSQISEASGLGRESLYKTLNENSHPRFETILKILNALNVQMTIVPKKVVRKKSLVVAEPQTVYVPDPTKLPLQGNINLLELAKYAAAIGKDISKMTLEEIEKFKVQ